MEQRGMSDPNQILANLMTEAQEAARRYTEGDTERLMINLVGDPETARKIAEVAFLQGAAWGITAINKAKRNTV